MKMIIITNNALVKEQLGNSYNVEYFDVEFLKILEMVRDRIHLGNKLLTHPLSGSVKPYETPYKSIIIEDTKDQIDMDSLSIIEQSIETTKKFAKDKGVLQWDEGTREDFQVIDLSLIENALNSVI